jgi:hypothetical protein
LFALASQSFQLYFSSRRLMFFGANSGVTSRGRQFGKTLILGLTSGDALLGIAYRLHVKVCATVAKGVFTHLWRFCVWSPLWTRGLQGVSLPISFNRN